MPLFDVYLTASEGRIIKGTRNSVAASHDRAALLADEKLRGYHAGNRVVKPRRHRGGIYDPVPSEYEPYPV